MKVLTPEESRAWQSKIKNRVDADPLVFADAKEAELPMALEVTNGQDPSGGRTLVIHVFKRADISQDHAINVMQHALTDVFGAQAADQADCDYRNLKRLKERFGDQMIRESCDTMTVIFRPGPIALTRDKNWVRNQLIQAIQRRYRQSL